MLLRPKQVGTDVTYLPGIYEIKITNTGTAEAEIWAICLCYSWACFSSVSCEIATKMQDGSAPVAAVTAGLTSESSAVDTLGRYVITVAAYNHHDPDPFWPQGVGKHEICHFSSQGPLRDFSDPPNSKPPIAIKPDIAAPGLDITAALGADTQPSPDDPRTPAWRAGIRFIDMQGTSMAAPMVTGVVALMLDKNPDLNTTEVLEKLKIGAAGRPGEKPKNPPDTTEAVKNAFGSGMVDALKSHTITT